MAGELVVVDVEEVWNEATEDEGEAWIAESLRLGREGLLPMRVLGEPTIASAMPHVARPTQILRFRLVTSKLPVDCELPS